MEHTHIVVSGIFLLSLVGRGAGKGAKVKERIKWKRAKNKIKREKVEKKKKCKIHPISRY